MARPPLCAPLHLIKEPSRSCKRDGRPKAPGSPARFPDVWFFRKSAKSLCAPLYKTVARQSIGVARQFLQSKSRSQTRYLESRGPRRGQRGIGAPLLPMLLSMLFQYPSRIARRGRNRRFFALSERAQAEAVEIAGFSPSRSGRRESVGERATMLFRAVAVVPDERLVVEARLA